MPSPRRLLLLSLPALLLLSLNGWRAPAAADGGVWPVQPGIVLRGFVPPVADWDPGHRGVDLAADVGDPVVAPTTGTISFAARLAGRGVVVVSLPDGRRTTLEPVTAAVEVGDGVLAGDLLGTVEATAHCGWTPCVHWGLRRDEVYLDPLTLLGLVPPVLLPLDGHPGPVGPVAPPVVGDGPTPGPPGEVTARGWPGRARARGAAGARLPDGDGSVPADRRAVQLLGGLGQLAP